MVVFSQQPLATPVPQPSPQPIPQTTRIPPSVRPATPSTPLEKPGIILPASSDQQSDFERLPARIIAIREVTSPLYRKPTEKELKIVAPDSKWLTEFGFRDNKAGGVIRLMPDLGCARNVRVIRASEECLRLSMPGAANSFSFRTRSYRIRRLADITLDGDSIVLAGIFMHAVLVPLGNVNFESVGMKSYTLATIDALTPPARFEDFSRFEGAICNSLESMGIPYVRRHKIEVGGTFVFRGIAYRGRVIRAAGGFTYNEMDFDRRRDVLVIFRVLERGNDGSVTLVYRILRDSPAPKIKIPKSAAADPENSIKAGT